MEVNYKPKRLKRLPQARKPPKGYVYKEDKYLSDERVEFGNSLKIQYPELRKWDGGCVSAAWGAYTNATGGAEYYHKPPRRMWDFLAYLYAEQELRPLGLMVQDNGASFVFYCPNQLGEFWGQYDEIMESLKVSTE